MNKPLVSQKILDKSNSGRCFVPYHRFLDANKEEIREINTHVKELSEANPELTFWTNHSPIAGGVTISWERTGILNVKGKTHE